jgi:hypothetical protein
MHGEINENQNKIYRVHKKTNFKLNKKENRFLTKFNVKQVKNDHTLVDLVF